MSSNTGFRVKRTHSFQHTKTQGTLFPLALLVESTREQALDFQNAV